MSKQTNTEGVYKDIDFITAKGLSVKLKWDKKEWRAYRHIGGKWESMMLGAGVSDGLIDYIKRRF